MSDEPQESASAQETHSVRLSARIKQSNYERLEKFAVAKGWFLVSGKPNISRALNEALSLLDSILQRATKRRRPQ
jgi:hypothetical protein